MDRPVTEDPYVQVDCVPGPPTFQRTVIEEIYQNERRLTQFSGFSTKQMFPTDRAPWADAKNRPQYKEGVQLPVSHTRCSYQCARRSELTVEWACAGGRDVALGW